MLLKRLIILRIGDFFLHLAQYFFGSALGLSTFFNILSILLGLFVEYLLGVLNDLNFGVFAKVFSLLLLVFVSHGSILWIR